MSDEDEAICEARLPAAGACASAVAARSPTAWPPLVVDAGGLDRAGRANGSKSAVARRVARR